MAKCKYFGSCYWDGSGKYWFTDGRCDRCETKIDRKELCLKLEQINETNKKLKTQIRTLKSKITDQSTEIKGLHWNLAECNLDLAKKELIVVNIKYRYDMLIAKLEKTQAIWDSR